MPRPRQGQKEPEPKEPKRVVKKRLVPRVDLAEAAGRLGWSQQNWADAADVSVSTIKALRNPAQQPGRVGGASRPTSWKLAESYAARSTERGHPMTIDEAHALLFEEREL
jgi:hypothetical protein